MQRTRQLILQYIKEHGQATVEELTRVLELTSVTVRHHLDILRSQEMVSEPVIRRRATPGRPQYVYTLADKAADVFPNNYEELAAKLLETVRVNANPQAVGAILAGVAGRLTADAPSPAEGATWPCRLDRAVTFLNQRGYIARWEALPEGYLLQTCNCPYEALAPANPELCQMDMSLVGNLLGATPERASRVVEGADTCSYLIRAAGSGEDR